MYAEAQKVRDGLSEAIPETYTLAAVIVTAPYLKRPPVYPDLSQWPELLLDELLLDYGISIETLNNSDDPVVLVIAAGMSGERLMEIVETDHIRTEKRCAD